ncbi:hypothetical protein AHAS_Ahas11G0297800 [Arachis hypogaea]
MQAVNISVVDIILWVRNTAQEVNGIWFYNARECEEVANLFNRILNAYAEVPPKSKVSSTKRFSHFRILPIYAKLRQCLYAVEPPMNIITGTPFRFLV